ncbi:MAG: enoyl-CoA hydratase-related protein [Legionellaceae bacterium]|nr:enoyl-CoA hydratase-related protein [Legionellaceae bacterium]
MTSVSLTQHSLIGTISLQRSQTHNALDGGMITALQSAIEKAIADPQIQILLLQGDGKHFCAGADLHWMLHMAEAPWAENLNDATRLAQLLYTWHHCPKLTVCSVQGAVYGGAAGLVAASDMVIASEDARFCFSEVKLGLIPAVISPYVVRAIGARLTQYYAMTATPFSASQALAMHLIHYQVTATERQKFTETTLQNLLANAPHAVQACKKLISHVAPMPITENIIHETAHMLATIRMQEEAQQRIHTFLTSTKKG